MEKITLFLPGWIVWLILAWMVLELANAILSLRISSLKRRTLEIQAANKKNRGGGEGSLEVTDDNDKGSPS